MKKKVLSLLFAASVFGVVASGGVLKAHAEEANTFEPTRIRVIKEEKYLEIYWDREMEDSAVIDSYVLKNGDVELELYNPGQAEMYFYNQGVGFTSFGYEGDIDEKAGLTLEIKGTVKDATDGSDATVTKKTYNVTYENYYTKSYTSESGIVCQSSDDVDIESLKLAAEMIDIMLSKTDTGIPAALKKNGAKMSLYGAHENAYFVPEHRSAWNPSMYYVEGYGGSFYNKCVSSIAERNVIRSREGAVQTGYKNENILVHEFGHCVKLCGMEGMEDKSLANEFYALYKSRKKAGMWPNTYAGSNPDEFFATMCAVWFNVMDDAKDWNDGVRCPVNTREELKEYDPETYAFFEKIFPSDKTMPAPWDKDLQDLYKNPEGGGIVLPEAAKEGNHNFTTDEFKLKLFALNGNTYLVTRDGDSPILWWNYCWDSRKEQSTGGEYEIVDAVVWTAKRTADGYYQLVASTSDTNYGGKALAEAADGSIVYVEASLEDNTQLWTYESVEDDDCGIFVNVSTGHVIGLDGSAADGTVLKAVERDDASEVGWALHNLTSDSQLFPRSVHDFETTYFSIISSFDDATRVEAWDGVCVWNTGDSTRNSWKIVPTNDGYFYIEGVDEAIAGKVLAPEENGKTEGTLISPEEKDASDDTQLWRIEIEDGSIRFINKASGLVLAIKDGSVTSGNKLVLAEANAEDDTQLWKVTNKTTEEKLVPADIPNAVEEEKDNGNEDDGNKDDENKDDGNKDDGNKDDGNKDDGNKNDGNKDDGNEDDGNKDDGNKDDGNKDDGNKDDGNKDDGNKDDGNKDDGNKDDGNKDDGNKDDGNKDDGSEKEEKAEGGVATGDPSNMVVWFTIMAACAMLGVAQVVSRKRHE